MERLHRLQGLCLARDCGLSVLPACHLCRRAVHCLLTEDGGYVWAAKGSAGDGDPGASWEMCGRLTLGSVMRDQGS